MQYRVLFPAYSKTGEKSFEEIRGEVKEVAWEKVTWIERGTARNMREAKKKFGGHPVLEPISGVH